MLSYLISSFYLVEDKKQTQVKDVYVVKCVLRIGSQEGGGGGGEI